MKIAFVHEMLVKLGGAERLLKSLCEIFPEAPIYTLIHNPRKVEAWFKDKKIHPSPLQPWFRIVPNQRLFLPFMANAIEKFDFRNFDMVISSSSAFAHGIKTGPKTKHICYCHSPMRYAWDYTHEYTKDFSPLKRYLAARTLTKVRQWDFRTSQNPDVLIANSENVRKRIQKYWRRDAEVIYPPVDVKRFTPTAKHDDYFLIVSALTPFKRIDIAIHTFNKIRRRLLIIGDGAQKDYLKSFAGPNIEFLGHKSDDEVHDYLQNCRALIFPGEEDFGIVPVEAMAAGKPVLAYGKGGVLESVQAGISGEFFQNLTPESLEDGLARLMANEPRYDIHKIRAIAERFDEGVFKEKMKKIVKMTLEQ